MDKLFNTLRNSGTIIESTHYIILKYEKWLYKYIN